MNRWLVLCLTSEVSLLQEEMKGKNCMQTCKISYGTYWSGLRRLSLNKEPKWDSKRWKNDPKLFTANYLSWIWNETTFGSIWYSSLESKELSEKRLTSSQEPIATETDTSHSTPVLTFAATRIQPQENPRAVDSFSEKN